MLLRVPLIGDGTERHPYRVDLPTYQHIHGNIAEGVALVTVPPSVLGLTEDDLKDEEVVPTTEGPYYPKLSAAVVKIVNAHFKDAYPGKNHQLEIREA